MWTLRLAGPADLPALQGFVGTLSVRTRAQRFTIPLRELPVVVADALARDDPAHRFVVAEHGDRTIGLGQLVVAANATAEVALVVADDWQGLGVGRGLLSWLANEARRRGLRALVLETLIGNRAMQSLARRAGFTLSRDPDDADTVVGRQDLAPT
jgi:GNAT superfamily N-acetyltransferase